jgi:prepilin-type N-terminal cleavage/methylation domain-containing protein
MKLFSRQGFTLLELMITVAVIAIVSSITLRSTYTFLQEQKLRQAANEFVSYLLTARAKALREASVSGKACEVTLNASDTIVAPTNLAENVCNDAPPLPTLDLLVASGGKDLVIRSTQSSALYITFTRMGTVASANLSDPDNLVALPRIFYFYNSATLPTEGKDGLQRCVMVDLNSIRMGWRKWEFGTLPISSSPPCTYNGN